MRGFQRSRSRPIALRQGLSQLGVTLLLQGMEGFQTVVNLVLGVLTNATCIEENGVGVLLLVAYFVAGHLHHRGDQDRKSTRLNSSHANISYAVFCLKKNN